MLKDDDQEVAISVPLGDWLFIDAAMDNAIQSARDTYDDAEADRGLRIRQAGWRATGHLTGPVFDSGVWPPSDDVLCQVVAVPLRRSEWSFVLSTLQKGNVSRTALGQVEEARRAEAIVRALTGKMS